MINVITKDYFYKELNKIEEWDKFYNISLKSNIELPESLCYFVYKKIFFVYIQSLKLILVPRKFNISKDIINEISRSEILIDSWSIKLVEKIDSGFSYTKNCLKTNCTSFTFNRDIDYCSGKYEIHESISNETFEIELYVEDIYWKSYYLGFPEKRNLSYPIPKEVKYKDELFKLIINSKWKKS